MNGAGSALLAARRLVSGLLQQGLAGAVVSPGSRNAPLMQAFRDAGVHHVVSLDERSAAHHALGMALSLGRPVAVCCTSGTAAINHGPALAEAHRVGLPLISLTADRPAGAADQWESQTLEQNRLHDLHVRASFTWTKEGDDGMLDRMRSALSVGPIHINCPFDEPLYPAESGASETETPALSGIGQTATSGMNLSLPQPVLDRLERALAEQQRILLLCGTQPLPLDAARLDGWTRSAVVAADSTSGMGAVNQTIVAVDRWMRRWTASGIPWEDMKPDLVIGFGAPLLSKSLRNALRTAAVDHIHIEAGGRFPTAFGNAPLGVAMPIPDALYALSDRLAQHTPSDPVKAWQWRWHHLESKAEAAHGPAVSAAPWSDLQVHAALHEAMPHDWDVHLANSTPVRYAQLFHRPDRNPPWSNRGVAGIDGCTSTAVGAVLAGRRTTLITGDLGFLYDANAFHVHPLPAELRVAVIHNGGGGVFRWLDGPQRTGLLESHFEMRHGLELRSVCDLHGLEHQRVTGMDELREALADWWSPSDVPRVLEIATPPEASAEAHRAYMETVSA